MSLMDIRIGIALYRPHYAWRQARDTSYIVPGATPHAKTHAS